MPWITTFAKHRVEKRAPSTAAERRLAQVFRDATRRLAEGSDEREILAGLNTADRARVVAAFNWPDFQQALMAMEPHLKQSFAVGGKDGAAGMGIRFDLNQPAAISWAESNAAKRVVEITAQQQQTIADTVGLSLRGGMDVHDVAGDLKSVVGLHTRFANAVVNYHGGLLEQGTDPLRAQGLAERYANKLLNVRTDTIARTEIQTAQVAGRLQGWQQVMQAGLVDPTTAQKQWIVADDERLCEDCAALEDEVVAMNEAFSSGDTEPPMHPDCRCDLLLITPTPAPAQAPTRPSIGDAA